MRPWPLFLVLCGCAAGNKEEYPLDEPAPGYAGPAVTTSLSGSVLRVTVEVPTGGYRLALRSSSSESGVSEYRFQLVAPPEGLDVAQAVERKTVEVEWVGGDATTRIFIQETQEGAHYLVEPEFQLARTLRQAPN